MKAFARSLLVILVPLILIACSGSPNPETKQSTGSTGSGTTTFTIGGSVSGLTGSGLALQDNLGNNLTVTANGTFTFTTAIATGQTYSVSVLTQPTNPVETCTVTNGRGTATVNVTNVTVTCNGSTTASIGGAVSGLTGSGLVLQDNGGDNLTIAASGPFTFKLAVTIGQAYSVTVLTQPSNPVQTCSVASGSGTATGNVSNVQVVCTSSTTASISGQVTGLLGSGLVLQDNGGDNLTISKTGTFTFATPLTLGSMYSVTVLTEPATPSQICTVAGGSGTAAGNVGNIVVTCSAGTLSIGGSVSGLSGTGLVLQSIGGSATIGANGTFTFPTLVPSGTAYTVTVATQPTGPAQSCTVNNATGTATANVTTVEVVCPAVFFSVGGQVVGLVGNGGGMTLQNNGGDNLLLTGNGPFTFVTQIAAGGQYDVQMFVGPTTQPQGCVTWDYQGLVTSAVTSILVDCGHNDWIWLDGSNTANANGTPSATAPTPPITALDTASPGGRKYPATWVDKSGNLWLFGGEGWDTVTTPEPIFLNDMWVYTGTQYYYGGYDTYWVQSVVNGSGSGPQSRWGAVTWTDSSGKLWLFAGQGGGTNFLNDMWTFNTTSQTWTPVHGNSTNGVYGTKGSPSGTNWPGARWGATAQLDNAGNLWLFGGFGYDASSSTPGLLNDLWEYTAAGQWVWLSGSSTINQDGVYGTQGTGAASNAPGGRQASMSWLDPSGNFWLFGGYNLSPLGQPNAFNDLWEFSGGQWTWVSGSNSVNQTGNYGVEGAAAASNAPGARWASATWADGLGGLWLFGGEGFDATADGTLGDLWEFNTGTGTGAGQWTYVKGPSSVSQPGAYGLAPGEVDYPHVINYPGTRWAPGYWYQGGYLWMFGGEGYDSTTGSGGIGLMNDLWRYLPYP